MVSKDTVGKSSPEVPGFRLCAKPLNRQSLLKVNLKRASHRVGPCSQFDREDTARFNGPIEGMIKGFQ
jgi:hypothetical protein